HSGHRADERHGRRGNLLLRLLRPFEARHFRDEPRCHRYLLRPALWARRCATSERALTRAIIRRRKPCARLIVRTVCPTLAQNRSASSGWTSSGPHTRRSAVSASVLV